jgi:two-component system, sensor histidine kinase YesM
LKFRFENTIKNNIIIYFSTIFIIIIAIIALFGYYFFSNILTNQILNYAIRIVDEVTLNIDSYFSQIKYIMQITAGNTTVIDSLNIYTNRQYIDMLHIERKTNDVLQDVLKFSPNITDLIIIGRDGLSVTYSGKCVDSNYNFFNQDWMPEMEDDASKIYFTGIHPQDYYLNVQCSDEKVVSAIIPIINYMSPNREFYGVLLSNLNLKNIPQVTKNISVDKLNSFLILDNKNDIIYSSTAYGSDEEFRTRLKKNLKNSSGNFLLKDGNKEVLVVFNTSQVTGWKFVTLISREELLQPLSAIKTFSFLLIIICIFIVVAVSILISEKISEPIVKLMHRMNLVEQGNFDVKLYDKSTKEIEILSDRMDLMVERINKLNRDIYLYEIKNKEAELKALQAQINPHFLLNTLQSIKALSVMGKNSEASKMTTIFGKMIRYTAYDMDELVPITCEISHVHDYLHLQSIRYENKFTYNVSYDKSIEIYRTLKLILQPIVENVIIHGLDDSRCIHIEIGVEDVSDDGILFTVLDNGVGIDEIRLEKIRNLLEDDKSSDINRGIALKNVHSRIRLKFGYPYGITIDSTKSKGTCVTILIPKIQDDMYNKSEGCCK